MFNLSPRPEYFSPEHEEFRRTVRAFVERDHIYRTPYAREHWEARARENIEAEIACFDAPPDSQVAT